MSAPVTPYERTRGRGMNLVFKSGPLFISSKGLGWKSWKRRWFILTRTSLFFYKSDPNLPSLKGVEANLALGGIDLNNSGSVLVRTDKKLLTVLFPDGRAFTLKAETMEDLDEWKAALEKALVTAPSALLVGEGGIFRHDSIDAGDGLLEQGRERRPVKSMVVGRPILLALEDIDGSPSFLEKALCFIEQFGVKVEGVLRQSADVDDVDQRIRDYEQGKNEFGMEEDAHVIGDCIKHVLRELPSSPVPTPCCTALLEAHRVEGKEARIMAMCVAVTETFPEPNRRLLQRVLKMMGTVVSHSSENRMTASAVAACMAPLLLRPLLAGECGLEDDSDVSGDNASQLLAAAAAANSAQAIITILLEEHDRIFEVNMESKQPCFDMYPQVDDSGSEGLSEDEAPQVHDEGYQDAPNELDIDVDEDADRLVSGQFSESSGNEESDVYDLKVFEGADSEVDSPSVPVSSLATPTVKGWSQTVPLGSEERSRGSESDEFSALPLPPTTPWGDAESPVASPRSKIPKGNAGAADSTPAKAPRSAPSSKRSSVWGLSSIGKRNLSASAEATDSSGDEEMAIQRLEATRQELCNKIAKEAKGNAELQASLERRKQALHERRLALEQDVMRLQEQLQTERDLRAALELGLGMHSAQLPMPGSFDSKTRAELEEIAVVEADVARLKQKVTELHSQLSQQRQQQGGSLAETNDRYQRVKKLQAQQKVLQQELERTLALCQNEKQKNNEIEGGRSGAGQGSTLEQVILHHRNALAEAKETLKVERARGMELRRRALQQDSVSINDWRQLQPPAGPSSSGRQFAWRHGMDGSSADPRQFESLASEGPPADLVGNGSMFQRPQVPSYALVELSSRLDFFKERRSQLMEQLHNLDLKFTSSPSSVNSQDGTYSSPQWTRQH
ncbi:hypothetical protein GOP47_0014878 [Adiantum capillus-veneris]|uniref:Rho GTPase-activating protein 7 n=1 Tax=Adiantum capillus-veneris TaxID=13818 RepID=A0A9D4UMK4_ADICA|nr:hypothetical protein GOP47_0014878 [Adiantum capillus-veneris]